MGISDVDLRKILSDNAQLVRALAETKGVRPDISERDMLLDFLVRLRPTDPSCAITQYFSGGEDCARKFASLCERLLNREPTSVLEFAAGYGRVARYSRNLMPGTEWHASDIHREAIDFLQSRLGVSAHLSSSRPEAWSIGRTFEIVFALSFFSHIPDATFRRWLVRLWTALEPGGFLIFTTHGAVSLRNMKAAFDKRGYYWNQASDQLDLNPSDYGTSAVSRRYVERALAPIRDADLVQYSEAFWWNHQDLYVVRKKAESRYSRLVRVFARNH